MKIEVTKKVIHTIETPAYRQCSENFLCRINESEVITVHVKPEKVAIDVYKDDFKDTVAGLWVENTATTAAAFDNLFQRALTQINNDLNPPKIEGEGPESVEELLSKVKYY